MPEKQGTVLWPIQSQSQRKSTTESEREVLSNKEADSGKRKDLALSVERLLLIKRLARLYSDNCLEEPETLKPEAVKPKPAPRLIGSPNRAPPVPTKFSPLAQSDSKSRNSELL